MRYSGKGWITVSWATSTGYIPRPDIRQRFDLQGIDLDEL